MNAQDIVIYGLLSIAVWASFIGGFYIASHLWMKRLTSRFQDEASDDHPEAE
jgi:uncharacterized protein YneF (UPF0154 family)